MPKRSQVKKIKSKISSDEINGMFEEMMGIKDAEVGVIRPKLVEIKNTLRQIYKILNQFSSFVVFQRDFPMFNKNMDEIKEFLVTMKELFNNDIDKPETEVKYFQTSKEELNVIYKGLKDHNIIKTLIVFSSTLRRYKKYIEDTESLDGKFINLEPGLKLHLFPFSNFDFKMLWGNEKITNMVKTYVLTILNKLWKLTFKLYKTTTSPDVDIEEFTKVIISSLQDLKKQPGLNRCHKAFKKIEDSVGMLTENFDGYYRDSISSGNANLLIESFIIDVSKEGNADASLTREFRVIIQYMQKLSNSSGKSSDPNVKKVFSMLNNNFDLMEKN